MPAASRASGDFASALRTVLKTQGDPQRAESAAQYMKSEMPFAGFAMPNLRREVHALIKQTEFAGPQQWLATIAAVWRGAHYREERYAAVMLFRHNRLRRWLDLDALPLAEEMIRSGAWWDFVDELASHIIGQLLQEHREFMSARLRDWAVDKNMWNRRTALLAQLRAKAATDETLLEDCILPSIESKEFFLRKAIGWALRAYAYTDPGYVQKFVATHDAEMSGLSKREALKNL